MKLSFTCPDEPFSYGHKYDCEIKLVNEGTEAIKVNLIDTPLDPRNSVLMNMYINVHPFDYRYMAIHSTQFRDPTHDEDVLTLYPGEEIGKIWDLEKIFAFNVT